MRYSDISTTEDPGLFVAINLDDETCEKLHRYALEIGVPNPIPPSDYHSTIISSTTSFDFEPRAGLGQVATPTKLEVWKTSYGPVLVLSIASDYLTKRFEETVLAGGEPEFPDFKPHVSLSYNAEDFDVRGIALPDFGIVLSHEISKPNEQTG